MEFKYKCRIGYSIIYVKKASVNKFKTDTKNVYL